MRERHSRVHQACSANQQHLLWSVFLVVLVAGGLFFGYLFYASIRDIVAYGELPFLLGGLAGPAQPGGPLRPALGPEPQLTERVNILLLGIDRRDNEPGPWRTDTMILFSIDPATKSASILSIPRDLWVPLPGLNRQERVNAAYVYGELHRYPGGGAGLAKRTVQHNLGVPVHYYVRIDFRGFERAIDYIGGIEIDVPREIIDNEYPTPDYGTMRLHIKAGPQHMDGDLALKYARTRHGSSDIDRGRRQLQVISAVRAKVLSLNVPLSRVPGLLQLLGDSVLTDMSLGEILAVGRAAQQVQDESIRQGVIDETMVTAWRTPQGWDVLLPRREEIREMIAEVFPVPTKMPESRPLGNREQLAQEAARIEVHNGTSTAGLASKVATDLRSAGYNVVRFGNADRLDYAQTVLIVHNEKRYSLDSLQAKLNIADDNVSRQSVPGSDVDIRVILGANAIVR